MKKLIYLFLLISNLLQATNYYVKSGGSDAAAGTSDALAWGTLTKVNNVWLAGTFNPGDSILLKRGDTFYGTLTVGESGTSGNNIITSAYGLSTLAKPIITGFTTITGWVNQGGGVYAKAISPESPPTIVTVNGANTPIGRYPNAGYLTYESFSTTVSITDNQTNSSVTNWTGAEIVIRKNHWITDKCIITAHSGTTITYTGGSTSTPNNNYGYFIQNDLRCLDVVGEWAYLSGTLYMYFGANNPTLYNVNVTTLNTGITMTSRSYVTFVNLNITGFNMYGIYASVGSAINVTNCGIRWCGIYGIRPNAITGFSVTGGSIIGCHNSAFNSSTSCISAYIGYTSVDSTAMIEGQSGNGDGNAFSIVVAGLNAISEYNSVTTSGYLGIQGPDTDSFIIRNNFVKGFCLLKDDGGGIYTYMKFDATITIRRYIQNNIVISTENVSHGAAGGAAQVRGIYADGRSTSVTISNNTIVGTTEGLFIQGYAKDIVATGNTIYNNDKNLSLVSMMSTLPNHVIKKNIMVARNVNQIPLNFSKSASTDFTLSQVGELDSNMYLNPFSYSSIVEANENNAKLNYLFYSSSNWASLYEPHSRTNPVSVPKYAINSLLSANLIPNGTFTSNITGASYGYNTGGVASVTWDNSNKINGGSAKLVVTTLSTNNNQANIQFSPGAIKANTKYLIRFSALGSANNSDFIITLQLNTTPYTQTARLSGFKIGPNVNTYEAILESTVALSNSLLMFKFNDVDCPVYLDNVEFYEADITLSNPDTYIAFDYNNASVNKTMSFTGRYYDAYGTSYIGSKTLSPYTSAVLIKDVSYVDNPIVLPTVIINNIAVVKTTEVSIYSSVLLNGGGTISERGIVWSTSANPTTGNNKQANGSGLGVYLNTLTNLSQGTTYHLRSYAINEMGTAYSSDVAVTTYFSSNVYNSGKAVYEKGKIVKN